MKLVDLLNEGLIKLPKGLQGEVTKFFVRTFLAYYQEKIEEELVGKAYYEAKKLADETAKSYDAEVGDDDIKAIERSSQVKEKFLLTEEDLPYRDKLSRIYPNFIKDLELPVKVTVILDFGHPTGDASADFDPNDNTIRASMGHMKLTQLESEDDRRKALQVFLEQALGLIDHELTHAIQHIVLVRFHKAQVQNSLEVAKAKGINMTKDTYFSSQIEFDPWIKGEAAVFRSIEREMKRINHEYDRKLSMEFFTAAKGEKKHDFMNQEEMTKVMFTAPSVFFMSLRKNNQEKWKKAVKLFYQYV